MIHIITKGGMGNQMFQYALALQIRKVNGSNEKIILNGALHPFSKDKRKLSLNHFALDAGTKFCSVWHGCILMLYFIISLVASSGFTMLIALLRRDRKLVEENEEKLTLKGIYYTSNPYSMPKIELENRSKHIYSYCQTPLVVQGIEDELRRSFIINTPPSQANKLMLDKIRSCNSVCVHVRRGDYELYPQYQVCNYEYYRTAIEEAKTLLINPVFFIFSNSHEDIEWIKENFEFDALIHYVDLENPDYEELRLMVACNHFIIANSTFSWWAAVLSKYQDKQVWCPRLWFKNAHTVKMSFEGWRLL